MSHAIHGHNAAWSVGRERCAPAHHHLHQYCCDPPLALVHRVTRLVFHRPHGPRPVDIWLRLARQFVPSDMQPNYRLVPIPAQLYAHLTAGEFLRSDHYAIVAPSTYEQTVAGHADQYWRNVVFVSTADGPTSGEHRRAAAASADAVTQAILRKPSASVLMGLRPAGASTPLEPNAIYVSETCFRNCTTKFRLDEAHGVRVQLQDLQQAQRAPQLATKATVFTINQPNELPNDIVDEILTCYFRTPRVLHRNYTYEIGLDARLLGQPLWVKHLPLFRALRSVHFRCVHLESADNAFELCAVVVKGMTALQQTTSINAPLPGRRLHALCPGLTAHPGGLTPYFEALRACVRPFVGQLNAADADDTTNGTPVSALTVPLASLPMILVQGHRGAGKTTVLHSVAAELGVQVLAVDCGDIVSQIAAQTEAKLKQALVRAKHCQPLILALMNFEVFGVDNEGREDHRAINMFESELVHFFDEANGAMPVIVIAVSNESDTKPLIRRLFLETVHVEPLDKAQRAECLNWLHTVQRMSDAITAQRLCTIPLCSRENASEYVAPFNDIEAVLLDVADRTPGFLFGDVKLLYSNTVNRCRFLGQTTLDKAMFDHNLNEMQALFADSLGAPKVPKVLWSDIGGLAKLKEEIQTSIGLPLKHLHLMGKNLRRSGILLYGPPGTGKTLVAKAVATECNLSFLSVQGPELLNMYVGQSEQNVREVFARARSAAPCVVFLDELDSLAPNRGMAGDSGGVMDRVVSQLMTEMNGMSDDADPTKQLFILAATNRPDLIDPSLLRPGRFDKLLYVGPCTTVDEKMAVLATQTKRFNMEPSLQQTAIAKMLPDSMTGADMYSICSNAWLSAVRRTIHQYEANRSDRPTTGDDTDELSASDVVVNMGDFKGAAGNFVPSVSVKDMEYFIKLKSSFSVA